MTKRVSISVPSAAVPEGYKQKGVQVHGLTPEQSAALAMLREQLSEEDARCKKNKHHHPNGVVVDSSADAIRWLLDRVYESMTEVSKAD